MNIKNIDKFVKKLNDRLKRIEKIDETIVSVFKKKEEMLKTFNSNLTSEMETKINDFIRHEFSTFEKKIADFENELFKNFSEETVKKLRNVKCEDLEVGDTISTCHYSITGIINSINTDIHKLNNFDFNSMHTRDEIIIVEEKNAKDEPTIMTLNGKEIDINSNEKTYNDFYQELTLNICTELCMKLDSLKKAVSIYRGLVEENLKMDEFNQVLVDLKQNYLAVETQLADKIREKNIDKYIIQEDDEINSKFFDELEQNGAEGKIDATVGADNSKYLITIGDFATKIIENKHLEYLKNSKYLSKKLVDGNLSIPYTLNLKENGNILLDVYEDGPYSKPVYELVHNLILDFLFSFPSGRLNLCLFDVDNVGNFAKYTPLKQINNELIHNGITREENNIAQNIRHLEALMHNIDDEKISASNTDNIFEYNDISVANPQSFHLVVILNYPKGFTTDASQRLLKLIKQGNRSGIYVMVVNNRAIANDNAYDDKVKNEILASMKKSMHVITESTNENGKFSIDTEVGNNENKSNIFKPFDELKIDDIKQHLNTLQIKAKNDTKISIEITKMFDYSAKMQKNGLTEDSSVMIEVPIGMRGGEVQSLELSTSGDGSAHTVVIGGTGSGKSNLLHTIVLSACERYKPSELQLYLIDFKGGVEFKYYEADGDVSKQLPHIKLTGLTSDPEDGVAILDNIRNILHSREKLFRENNVEDIVQYNLKYKPRIPRLLVMIDEVQELFERNESLGQHAINIMSELFKKGRAFGISLLWASQNVPKVAGLRDKVISQIGNRISLRLNNADDASEIDIDPMKVRTLNRPEKGLGIIKSMSSNDSYEFRVAYAETSEKRHAIRQRIIDKWSKEPKDGKYLYVVGNNEIAKPFNGNTLFTKTYTEKEKQSLSNSNYLLDIGQNFISGENFTVPFAVRGSTENMWIAGSSTSELRSVMSFTLLSTIINNRLNLDLINPDPIYYISGELEDQRLDNNILFKLPRIFNEDIKMLGNQKEIIDLFIKILIERRKRVEDIQKIYDPIFIFIHKIQAFADLFKDSFKTYEISDEPVQNDGIASSSGFSIGGLGSPLSFNSSSSVSNNRMSFQAIFNEVFGRGPDVGIHIIMSIDTPNSISEIEKELRACNKKVILRGVKSEDLMMMNSGRPLSAINYNGIGYYVDKIGSKKIKIYNYDNEVDIEKLEKFAEDLIR